MKHAFRSLAVVAAAVASLVALAAPASAHPPRGWTSFSDGSTYKLVFEGETVTAQATGAIPGVGYYLVFGRQQGDFDLCHNGTIINPNLRVADSNGSIAPTSGVIPVVSDSEGWELAFCGTGSPNQISYTRTHSALLSVYSTTH